jgi:acid phosphatase
MIGTFSKTVIAVAFAGLALSAVAAKAEKKRGALDGIKHFVVIYQENHSFDNLYGGWEGVDGLAQAQVPQVSQAGAAFRCLPQNDVNLASPPLAATCVDAGSGISSAFANAPFRIDALIAATDKTCPQPGMSAADGVAKGAGLPGGCTRDIVHRYYQEQYQIDGGKMDRYVAGSDALGLTMGYYDTRQLPIYAYLHGPKRPHYVVADNFFQAAFGGSFLNHQWLVAARTPEWPAAVNDGSAADLHSVVDANGMPNSYALYASPAGSAVKDQALTASCAPAAGRDATPAGVSCGDFAVNTVQPTAWPYAPGTAVAKRLPPLIAPTLGDRLSAAGIDWAWYSGGWANAEGDATQPGYSNGAGPNCADANAIAGSIWPKCPDKLFQFHHQAFNYFAAYAPGTPARAAHLRDEAEFLELAHASDRRRCKLKPVSFVKPQGEENEHPGYASESAGSEHLVALVKAIEASACAADTMIIVTYDEFGGQADHVAPPAAGNGKGPYDRWGPGTRVPALIIAPRLAKGFAVDHAVHDTTSILATIEHRFGLAALGSRDAAVLDLSSIYRVGGAAKGER